MCKKPSEAIYFYARETAERQQQQRAEMNGS
jgi:hypothetical protein